MTNKPNNLEKVARKLAEAMDGEQQGICFIAIVAILDNYLQQLFDGKMFMNDKKALNDIRKCQHILNKLCRTIDYCHNNYTEQNKNEKIIAFNKIGHA
jgi:hypothetical protein